MTHLDQKIGQNEQELSGHCTCSKVKFHTHGRPLMRVICHCDVCKAYNRAEHADVLVMQSKHVTLAGEEEIRFEYHRQPPILRRGRCGACDGVAVERMHVPLVPNITVIPTQTLEPKLRLPEPVMHIFYDRRTEDHEDDLPKHSGYLPSQLAFSASLLKALLR